MAPSATGPVTVAQSRPPPLRLLRRAEHCSGPLWLLGGTAPAEATGGNPTLFWLLTGLVALAAGSAALSSRGEYPAHPSVAPAATQSD